jgi:hypothetical protein
MLHCLVHRPPHQCQLLLAAVSVVQLPLLVPPLHCLMTGRQHCAHQLLQQLEQMQ